MSKQRAPDPPGGVDAGIGRLSFDKIFPLVSAACRQSRRFADTFSMCSEFGQTRRRENRECFRELEKQVRGSTANKTVPAT